MKHMLPVELSQAEINEFCIGCAAGSMLQPMKEAVERFFASEKRSRCVGFPVMIRCPA